jgi:iron complex outermembrane recepter protein
LIESLMLTKTTWPFRVVLLSACLAAFPVRAQDQSVPEYSLEELLKVEVVTASRKSQDLLEVPAAAFVLTQDDIERSGATSLPEALRLVPGVQVARLSSGIWAVSVRGFNDRFSNKLQVLVDGRSVYSPLFAGVMWEGMPVPLADIERIEIIRGPGAAVWGANAVNGVINIITRKTTADHGTMTSVSAGSDGQVTAYARHGFVPAENWSARLWAQSTRTAINQPQGSTEIDDAAALATAGARIDQTEAGISRTLNVSAFHSDLDYGLNRSLFVPPYTVAAQAHQDYQGVNLAYREERTLTSASDFALQVSAEHTDLTMSPIDEARNKFTADAQHSLRWLRDHELVWGGALSYSGDRLTGAYPMNFDGTQVDFSVWSLFAQDEWRLSNLPLTLSYGMRVDRSTLNGNSSVQPNLRALWTLTPGQVVWASIGRAKRLPARAEYSANINLRVIPPSAASPVPVEANLVARTADQAGDERLDMLEAGYRGEWSNTMFFDATAFVGRYRDLRSTQALTPYLAQNPLRYVQPLVVDWHGSADVSGAELALDWKLARDLRTRLSASHLELRADDTTLGPVERSVIEGGAARNQASTQLVWRVASAHELDFTYLHVGALPAYAIDGYNRFDARWAWRVTRNLELALIGQNIGTGAHVEIHQIYLTAPMTEVRSSWYAKLSMRF